MAKGRDAKAAANWVTGALFGALNRDGTEIADSPVAAEALGALIDLIAGGTISNRMAKDVFEEMYRTGAAPADIVAAKGLTQISDSGEIEAIVEQVIAEGAAQAEQFKSGNEKVLGWFVGQVMKATGGKANPQTVNDILRKKLSE